MYGNTQLRLIQNSGDLWRGIEKGLALSVGCCIVHLLFLDMSEIAHTKLGYFQT